MRKNHIAPESAKGQSPLAAPAEIQPRLVRKHALARANSVSIRTVDNWLRRGCPHVSITRRLTLFDPVAVHDWLMSNFGARRIGPAASRVQTLLDNAGGEP